MGAEPEESPSSQIEIVAAPAVSSHRKFARANREQRIKQIVKLVDEFLTLNIDDVAAEEQSGLVLRMLATLKSLASIDVYWNAEGERHEEERYALLGLQEDDMYAIGRHVNKADKHCETRKF